MEGGLARFENTLEHVSNLNLLLFLVTSVTRKKSPNFYKTLLEK